MQKKNLLMLLVLYIAATAITYGALAVLHKKSSTNTQQNQQQQTAGSSQAAADNSAASPLGQLLTIAPSDPRDQACPLNGAKFTGQEKDAWEKRRPLAVMIENSPDARPQSGLTNADIVFEAMAEGGVTRFMALFYCNAQSHDVTLAPVRSAREYFWQLASGFFRPLYVHVGGANTPGPADALGHIADAGWNGQNDMNQFSIGYPTFVRDYNRIPGKDDLATEHTMVTSTEKLWKYAADKRGWTNSAPINISAAVTPAAKRGKKQAVASAAPTTGQDWKDMYKPWSFQDGSAGAGNVNKISFEFWDGFDQYAVRYEYDQANNAYKRFLANAPHIDLNNNQQIEVKNAVVMFAEEKGPIDDKKHLLYTVTGTGDALVFQNGQVVKAKWLKKDPTGNGDDREAELFFNDATTGQPIQFVRGQIWISIVSPTTKVTY